MRAAPLSSVEVFLHAGLRFAASERPGPVMGYRLVIAFQTLIKNFHVPAYLWEAFPMCLLLWDHSVYQPPPPGWQKYPTLLDLRHWQDRGRGAPCLVDTGRDDQRGSLLVFVLPGEWRDVLESFLPETRNDILYMKFKFWGRLLVVDVLLNDAGTFEYPLEEFWLELFTVQRGLYHSAGGFLGFFFFFFKFLQCVWF